mgnify:CR=1 FL=1
MDQAQMVGIWVAAVLTLMVYSFLIADNPLFRLAEHLLIGTALGYAVLVILKQFVLPTLSTAFSSSPEVNPLARTMTGLGILWGLLLWFWLSRPARWVASWPLAIVFGVGSALAIGGALMGTLVPQVGATLLPLRGSAVLDNAITVVIVLAGLSYFFFTMRRDRPLGRAVYGAARFGRWSLMVALGAFLGTRVVALLNALIERLQFLGQWLRMILP